MNLEKLNKKDWLFKSQRQRVSPFPNYWSMETVCRDMKNKVGYNLSKVLYFLENNTHTFYLLKEDYEKVGQAIADRIFNEPKLSKKLLKDQHRCGKILVNFSRKANNRVKKDKKISNEKLYKLFSEFEKKYKDLYSGYGWVWICEDFLIQKLLDAVEEKISDKREASTALDILTKELTAMVATVERKAFLEMAVQIYKNEKWIEISRGGEEEIKKDKKLSKIIKKHERDYYWLTRDYEDPIMDFGVIVKNLIECFNLGGPEKEYSELTGRLSETEKKRKHYLDTLNFSKEQVETFASMRRVAYLKELRKRYVSESLYNFDDVLRFIGKKTYLSLNQVRHLATWDAKDVLLENKDLPHELNERISQSLWFADSQKTQIFTGSEAKDLFDTFLAVDKQATEFVGMAVSPGVVRGPIKIIINPDECDRVEKGDVILSIQVVPSFSTAIMKASALVCDGGHGITTHPATLAREAGIPGVIQTRFAREVLKDGDMVEVDGYKGTVRKL